MKRVVAFVLIFALLLGAFPVFLSGVSVGAEPSNQHTHSYTDSFLFDSVSHWRVCKECGERTELAAHTLAHGVCVYCGCSEQKAFPDVNYEDWYGDSVEYTFGKRLITGYKNGKFGFADNTQRQDFIIILSRLSGDNVKKVSIYTNFSDVPYGSYYYDATLWGLTKGVVNGYNDGRFGVGDRVTREQIICFLYNYATYKGYNTDCSLTSSEIEQKYSDYKSVSDYAKTAVLWAISNGIISGRVTASGTYISPKAFAQRAEIAAIFFNIAKKGVFEKQIKDTTNSSGYNCKQQIVGGSEEQAKELKEKVLCSKNTEEIYNITGKKYYISRDMDLGDIPANLASGDAILFERGGVWRVPSNKPIVLSNGVTIGAYGKGPKPQLYGSQRNYADSSIWKKDSANVYKTSCSGGNAGNIVFNGNACLGVKKWSKSDLKENYDFYFASNTLYLYYTGDLGKDFDSIEVAQRGELISFYSGCTIDNLCLKYCGSHPINSTYGTDNTTITNCEIGYAGGSQQSGTTRFGNGIQFGIGATNVKVKYNYIYECYDAGFTFQTWSSAKRSTHYYNIDLSENLIEKCAYGIEYFTTNTEGSGLYSDYKNISFNKNIIRFAGYEWSQFQRPDPWMTSLIRGGQWAYMDDCENFTITNNIFDISRACIVFWWWHDESKNVIHLEPHKGLTVSGNTYYQARTPDGRCMTYHKNKPVYAYNETQYQEAVRLFDSNPKAMYWYPTVTFK